MHVSHGDQGPQLPLTKGGERKKRKIIFIPAVYNTHMQAVVLDGETYWGTEISDTSGFAGPLPHSSCLRAEGWGSCRGGSGL